MKKIFTGVVIGIVLALSISVFAATYTAVKATFEIFVNGERFENAEPVVINGRTYLPVRALSEAMGVPINWNEELRRVELGKAKDLSLFNRNNPAPLNETQVVSVDDILDTYKAEITITEIVRGDIANQMIADANIYNDTPKNGHDYLLAKINFKLLEIDNDKALDVQGYGFKLYSGNNEKYENKFMVLSGVLDAKIYEGGNAEGWAIYEVAFNDSEPKIGYGQDYDGTGGVWFKAYE